MPCPSKKREYLSKEEAEQALIELHIQSDFRPGLGPVNVYQCDLCGAWHFTSKGERSKVLDDPEVKRQIRLGKLGSNFRF